MTATPIDSCPTCGSADSVRPKLLLVDEAWVYKSGVDARLAYCADLRVDDLRPETSRAEPLSQFVDGYYCSVCGKGFVSDAALNATHRRYK